MMPATADKSSKQSREYSRATAKKKTPPNVTIILFRAHLAALVEFAHQGVCLWQH